MCDIIGANRERRSRRERDIMPRGARTAVVMVDTRAPALQAAADAALPYHALTHALNRHYARRHGYAFRYYQLAEAGCWHARWGLRHPSYCKVPALAVALRRFARVAIVDSDAWFAPAAPPLPALLRAGAPGAGAAVAAFASDAPFSGGPNCGVMVWRASPYARHLLRLW